jgi:glycosyltransferase involved in cell wall biosynthesis
MKPLISIVMAVRNNSQTITPAIQSILKQTYKNWELIIIDDASTDNTVKQIKQFKGLRIKLIQNQKQLKLPRSLNLALEKAKGKYFARFDGDDICLPARLEKQIKFMQQNPKIDILGTWATQINLQDQVVGYLKPPVKHQKITKQFKNLRHHNPMIHPSLIFRNKPQYNPFFTLSQDFELILRSVKQGLVLSNLPEELVKLRVKPQSLAKTIKQHFYSHLAKLQQIKS